MSESAIRQAIYTILKSVTDIGRVYDYDRNATDWDQFINLFKDNRSGRISGAEISRGNCQSVKISYIEEDSTHGFIIRLYMGVNDADKTELKFNARIEAIRTAARGNHTLSGVCTDAGPITVPVIDTRTFGSVLCHYAELHWPVNELLT